MSIKHDKTFKVLEDWLDALKDRAPINISYVTRSINNTVVARIKTLELIYSKSWLYTFLLNKGVYPFVLFSFLTTALTYGAIRTYRRSTHLVLNLVGVLYPSWRCWQLIKQKQHDTDELKAWLTYWMMFGSFQVLDHWMDMVSVSRRKYNLYKLFILYWAQSPHSKGAELLYRHVLQKPQEEKREEEECEGIEVTRKETVYSYMDGYQPPHLLASNHSSDDDDSVKSGIITHAPTTTIVEKETFPLLNESAW